MTRDHREAILGLKFSPAGANDRDLFRVASPRIRFLCVDARVSLPASSAPPLRTDLLRVRLAVRSGSRDQVPRGLTPPSHSPCRAHKRQGRRPCRHRPHGARWFLGHLGLANVCRLQSLRATRHIELEGLSLGESLEPLAVDGREMDEHVLAVRLGDEAKALRLVEPLHGATSHLKLLVSGSEDPHLPRLTPRRRPVLMTGTSIDRAEPANKKPPECLWRSLNAGTSRSD